MAKTTPTVGRSYQEVKDSKGILKRAYELHFRKGLPWATVERELGLKIGGGMTALNCAERYIDVTDDQAVKEEGKEWRRKRRVALAARKKHRAPPAPQSSNAATDLSEIDSKITLQQVDERVEKRLREFASNVAHSIKMAVG